MNSVEPMKQTGVKNQSSPGSFPFGRKEGVDLEFKEATHTLPKNLFETICAFLNMDGGLVVLGVADDGTVTGVAPEVVEGLTAEVASLSNNPSKLDPPNLLFPQAEAIDGRWVIRIQVPTSSQVHQTGGHVFLRSNDGDYRFSGLNRIAGLVNRKSGIFSEQRVMPYLSMSDLRPDLFKRARVLMKGNNPKHPWLKLPPEKMLMLAGFTRKDRATGRIGYTLAAALMFGKDETIQQVAPGFKFDAILRRHDIDRYDDRLVVSTNLIDSYDLLMGFVEKHLNDPFYLEGTQNISLRSRIFRELVANLIAHREYTSPAPASMTIYRDRVEFKNPNIPHYWGQIDPEHFTPFAKNPTICKFLSQIGLYEELGSGVRNVTKYHPFYAPGAEAPTFTDEHMFTVVVPLGTATLPESRQESRQESGQESDVAGRILRILSGGVKSRSELAASLGHRSISGAAIRSIASLLQRGMVEYTIPERPQSRLQRYRLTDKGRAVLSGAK